MNTYKSTRLPLAEVVMSSSSKARPGIPPTQTRVVQKRQKTNSGGVYHILLLTASSQPCRPISISTTFSRSLPLLVLFSSGRPRQGFLFSISSLGLPCLLSLHWQSWC